MSKYRLIKCDFKTPDALIRALDDLKLPYRRAANLKENGLTLETHWTSYGGENQACAIALDRDALRVAGIPAMDGIAFRWNGAGYDLIQDHYDEEKPAVVKMLNQLRQRYGFHEVQRLARAKGYNVREQTTDQNGQIRLVLVRR